MKIRNLLIALAIFALILPLAAVSAAGRHRAVVADECDECADTAYVGAGHHGRAGQFGGMGGSVLPTGPRRPFAAPVYFGNAFPEYTLGSPDIYAGYDEDTVLVNPVRAKGPFHYPYWNNMYNGSPYYGKNWEQNWTVFGENGYYGDAQYWQSRQLRATAGYPGYSGGYGVEYAGARQSHNGQMIYKNAPAAGAYQGHYISNFDDFCCMPCTEPTFPLLSRLKNLLGCPFSCSYGCPAPACFYDPYCDPCYDSGCGITDFCDPCAGYVCDPCFAPSANVCDPCEGIGFAADSCCGDDFGTVVPQTSANGVIDSANVEPTEVNTEDNGAADSNPAPTPVAPTPVNPQANAPAANAPLQYSAPAANKLSNALDSAIPEAPKAPEMPQIPNADSLLPAPNQPAPNQPAPPANAPAGSGTGYLQMTVPENAVVYINGYETKMTGSERRFAARNLEAGVSYRFEIKVVVRENGQTLTDTQTAVLLPGTTMSVAFNLRNTNRQVALNH